MGFNELGDTIKTDLYDVESILTAGMPRGGKTFSVKTVMSQMVQFVVHQKLISTLQT